MPLTHPVQAMRYGEQLQLHGLDKINDTGYKLTQRLAAKAFGQPVPTAIAYQPTPHRSETIIRIESIQDLAYLLYFSSVAIREKMLEAIASVATKQNLVDLSKAVGNISSAAIFQLPRFRNAKDNQAAKDNLCCMINETPESSQKLGIVIASGITSNTKLAHEESCINLYLYLYHLNREIFNARLQHADVDSIKTCKMFKNDEETRKLAIAILEQVPTEFHDRYDFMVESVAKRKAPFALEDFAASIEIMIGNIEERIKKLSTRDVGLFRVPKTTDKPEERDKLENLLSRLRRFSAEIQSWLANAYGKITSNSLVVSTLAPSASSASATDHSAVAAAAPMASSAFAHPPAGPTIADFSGQTLLKPPAVKAAAAGVAAPESTQDITVTQYLPMPNS